MPTVIFEISQQRNWCCKDYELYIYYIWENSLDLVLSWIFLEGSLRIYSCSKMRLDFQFSIYINIFLSRWYIKWLFPTTPVHIRPSYTFLSITSCILSIRYISNSHTVIPTKLVFWSLTGEMIILILFFYILSIQDMYRKYRCVSRTLVHYHRAC